MRNRWYLLNALCGPVALALSAGAFWHRGPMAPRAPAGEWEPMQPPPHMGSMAVPFPAPGDAGTLPFSLGIGAIPQWQVDPLSYTYAGEVIYARSKVPPGHMAHYGSTPLTAALPYMISSEFVSTAAFQAAFPACTAAGNCNSTTYTTLSLDAAVWWEARDFALASDHQRTIFVDEGKYGYAGPRIKFGLGLCWIGAGKVGSGPYDGTGVVVFGRDGLFAFDGTLGGVGTQNPTGACVNNFSMWAANRTGVGGDSYAGGSCISLTAQRVERPGEFIGINDLCAAENSPTQNVLETNWATSHSYTTGDIQTPCNGYSYVAAGNCTSGSTMPTNWCTNVGGSCPTTDGTCSWSINGEMPGWYDTFLDDGTAYGAVAGNGVRSVHTLKFRMTDYCHAGIRIDAANHVFMYGADVETGGGVPGQPPLLISGNANDINLYGNFVGGQTIIARDGPNGPDLEYPATQCAPVSSMTGNSVTPVLTIDGGLGELCQYSSVNKTCGVWVQGSTGNTIPNGSTAGCTPIGCGTGASTEICGLSATIADAGPDAQSTQLTLTGLTGNGAYTGGASVCSNGPRGVTIVGNAQGGIVYSEDSTCNLMLNVPLGPGSDCDTNRLWLSTAPRCVPYGYARPKAFLRSVSDSTQVSTTGDGGTATAVFNQVDFDRNIDVQNIVSDAGPSGPAVFIAHIAGTYDVDACLDLGGFPDSGVTSVTGVVSVHVIDPLVGTTDYEVDLPSAVGGTGILATCFHKAVYLNYNASARINYSVSGQSGAIGILNDSHGKSSFSVRLQP
jgi:hypothetical protein